MPYSTVTTFQPQQNQNPIYSAPLITREETLKINIRVAHARYKNLEKPGSYEEELNKVEKLNNVPTIKIPKKQNSNNI